MPNQEVNELNELTSGQINDADLVIIDDRSADESKKWAWSTIKADILTWLGFTAAEGAHLSGVTSPIQAQIDAKQATINDSDDITEGASNLFFTSVERAKLALIEASATGDQTGAEIKTLYEAEADTNAFTDADHSKLDGIEALADVTDTSNVTAAGALMDSEVSSLSGVKTLTVPDSTTISTFGATLTDDTDASTARTTLGLVIGTDVQAQDADLQEIADLTPSVNDLLIHDGTNWTTESFIRGFFNGTFGESFDALVTSNGSVVTMSIEQQGGGDLTMRFSDGDSTLDCTPAATTTLSAGTDAAPTANYVYILQSTKAITTSTSSWPSAEHIKIGYFLVPSATFVQSNGVYVNQNWNDHAVDSDGQGHMTHITERSRRDGAYYRSGVDGNGTDGYLTPTASNVEFKSTSGVIHQMHGHTVPAHDTSLGDVMLVKNWSGDAYHDLTNLFDITADSTGTTISNNKYFNLVIWGVGNKGGEFAPFVINLPSGSYNGSSDAQGDVSGYDDYTIPSQFNTESSTGFLICRITIQMGTTWSVVATQDLRGTRPQSVSGGAGGAAVTEFTDTDFKINDNTDPSKQIAFEASSITASTVRTITVPDKSGTLAMTDDLHDAVTLAGTPNYLTLSGQELTLTKLDITDDTNLVAGTNITLTTNTLNVDDAFLTNDASDKMDGTLSLKEQASADADTATYGQIWVKTATPNELWFTDDAGTDFNLQSAEIGIACSDETTTLTTGTAKATFRMPYAMTLTDVRATVTTAPTGSVLTVDINESGTTVLSTKITIDATEKTSETAATAPVISDSALADDAEITIDIDTVGSTVAGAGLKVWLKGVRA